MSLLYRRLLNLKTRLLNLTNGLNRKNHFFIQSWIKKEHYIIKAFRQLYITNLTNQWAYLQVSCIVRLYRPTRGPEPISGNGKLLISP